jgi:hypothetical protein
MEFTDGEVVIEKEPSELDELVIDVVRILDEVGIEYVVVSGYVAVLFGRARATEDIDVLVEPFDEATADEAVDRLRDAGYWGSAMPLEDLYETLSDDLPVRIAEDGDIVPNIELKFATDEYDHLSLQNTVTVRLSGNEIRIGSLELQIAYKLVMDTPKDFEDALYLYEVIGRNLNTNRLEGYVERLGVEDAYERLQRS